MKRALLIILAVLLFASPAVALALDTSNALYWGIVRVTNNSTLTNDVSIPFTANTNVYIAGNYLNETVNNTGIVGTGGADAIFMPGFDGNPWIVQVPSIGSTTILDNSLFMGGNTTMNDKVRYFPGAAGANVTDSATLEPGDNFTLSMSGFVNTANGTDKNLAIKGSAVRLNISANVTGEIEAKIVGTGSDNATPSSGQVSGNTTLNQFSAINLVDGSTASSAFYTDVAGPGAAVMLDFQGTPTELISWRYYTDSGVHAIWDIEYSADNVTYQKAFVGLDVAGLGYHTATWESVGNWRYWRSLKTDPAIAGAWHRSLQVLSAESANITAAGVTTGEHDIVLGTDNNSLLVGLGVDIVDASFPVTDSLVFNAPLWHDTLSGASFTSVDSNLFNAVVTGATWSSTLGRTFDGFVDNIHIAGNSTLDLPSEITVEYWFNSSANQNGVVVTRDAVARLWTNFYAPNLEQMNHEIWQSNGVRITVPQTGVPPNEWNHLVMVADGSVLRVYRNGVLFGTTKAYNGTLRQNPAVELEIGLSGTDFYEGDIGEVRIYGKGLTTSEVLHNYNATKWKYEGGADQFIYNLLPPGGVDDSSSNWTFSQNNAMQYMETANLTTNGITAGSWKWRYGANFTDASGNGNTMTPSFRNTSSDPDVSAVLVDFLPITEAKAPSYSINITTAGWLTANMTQSSNFTTTTNGTYPGRLVLVDTAASGSVPIQLPELLISGVILLALSFFISWMMRTNREGSLFFKVLIIGAGMGVMIAIGVIDSWILSLFVMIAIAIVMASSQRTFTGTGNSGNNLIGFASMSFVGMTTINRILEGRLIQDSDVALLRETLAFQPFEVFGLFTIPVPNSSFLTNGLPSLVRWDYSFFGGNAQIFQYLLYSITAVVSFMLFVLVFGAIYQMFSRGR